MKLLTRFVLLIQLVFAGAAFGAVQVDINTADAVTLARELSDVGLVKAEAIVAYREAHGPFTSLEDLARVKGIGPRVIEENRERIVFGRPPRPSSGGGSEIGSPGSPAAF
ncbi:MAG TPA: ComEA family DNA-binding protein [Rhodanobacteraceae bacterium]|nr:ComEA family DNA-binding protein [Rhodanobacteraceae bacterium]